MKSLLLKLVRVKILRSLLLIFSVFILIFGDAQSTFSQNAINLKKSDSPIIEFLRLRVPSKDKEAWLKAEQETWEPWLKEKKGFLGRQLFWDPKREEALLLISWANRTDWKSIQKKDIESVQEHFEKVAMESTGNNEKNPFPIKSEGELLPQ